MIFTAPILANVKYVEGYCSVILPLEYMLHGFCTREGQIVFVEALQVFPVFLYFLSYTWIDMLFQYVSGFQSFDISESQEKNGDISMSPCIYCPPIEIVI